MSGVGGARRHGRWFDLLATVAVGTVVVGAALVPAVTANSGEAVTVRGDVTLDGAALQFFPVGFWTQSDGVVASTRTDAKGDFTLDVPATLDGYAFAGTAPDADRALITSGGRTVVRGVIGKTVPKGVSTPLYQGWETATGRALAGGPEELRFVLERPGRITGVSPVTGAAVRAVQVRRLDGSVVETLTLGARGRFASRPLVPGDYRVVVVPAAPLLPTAVQVAVTPGGTATASPAAPSTGGTIDGRATVDGRAAPSGVPVLLQRDGTTVAATQTGTGGTYRFAGLAPADYDVRVGVYPSEEPSAAPPSQVEVPTPAPTASASGTPAPSPTATPTDAPTASAVPLPLERTTDAGLPATSEATVPAAGTATVDTDLAPAGRVRGTVSGTDGVTTQVVVLDSGTGAVVRSTTAGTDGRYSVGGLQPGEQYELWAVTRPDDPTLARMGGTSGLATTSTSGVDIDVDQPAATLQGTVTGADEGTVTLGDPTAFVRTSGIDASGAYLLQGLVPGTFAVGVSGPDRVDSTPVAATIAGTPAAPAQGVGASAAPAETTQDLQPGPAPSVFKGWFISGGAGVRHVVGTATSTAGDVADLGPLTRGGHLTVRGLAPGTYTYDQDSFAGTVPAVDGPWWFAAPTGSFVLGAAEVKDVGPVVLHVRAR